MYAIRHFLISTVAILLSASQVFADPVAPNWSYVEKRLRKAGLEASFIESLKKSYDPAPFTEVLELNTLLFLRKADYHGVQVNDEAEGAVHTFINDNRQALEHAEKMYHVSKEVVASLLWIESRHGKNPGRFHVPSVFVDLVQADRPPVVRYLCKAAKHYSETVTRRDLKDIKSRAKKRVTWAIAELKAIQTMHRRNKDALKDFMGSFAGAFGMAQFEPSSYVHYAKAQNPRAIPRLEDAGDAIHSVAYYLHKNGWRQGRGKSYVRALMRYNNSHDYAAAILKLAKLSS